MKMQAQQGVTTIRKCTCVHPFQDSQYGAGMRVMNPLPKKMSGDEQQYRCTVCGREGR